MDYLSIIDQYYPSENELRRILLTHSRQVADRCLLIARKHPELKLDTEFLEEAAMLGGKLLREKGFVRHAQVCERHTGTGISREQIIAQNLPLPLDGCYEPDTIEEQVVCYADKFYSKTNPAAERTVEQTARSLEKFGEKGLRRFFKWVDMFE